MIKTKKSGRFYEQSLSDFYAKGTTFFKPLTREDEVELGKKIKKNDQAAVRKLVEANLRYVVKVAQKYKGFGLQLSDLVNEGNIGLIVAAKRFDYLRGVRFITYADWWIRQSMRVAIANQVGVIRLPLNKVIALYELNRKERDLAQALSCQPTPDDLANIMKMPRAEIDSILRAAREQVSLEALMSDHTQTKYIDSIEDKGRPLLDEKLLKESLTKEINFLLEKLSENEQKVLRLRYGLNGHKPMTLKEAGSMLGLSRERVRQIENRAKKKLSYYASMRDLASYLN